MQRAFKYRAYINKQTEAKANLCLERCRILYNIALEQRIVAYREQKKSVTCYQQINELTEFKKAMPEYKEIVAQILCKVMQRLDHTYGHFIKEGKGYPRFKSKDNYNSFILGQVGNGWKLVGKYLYVSRVGLFKLKLHRPIEGDIKDVIIKRMPTGKWYVCFHCDGVEKKILPKTNKVIGIDVGLRTFCADSDENKIENPRYLKNSLKLLRVRNRKVCRRIKGSNGRKKARILMAKVHGKMYNQRNDFLHKIANQYIAQYDEIYTEKLNIRALKKDHHTASAISDVSWGKFYLLLAEKAESAGRKFVQVNPRNTSQRCSNCGHINKITRGIKVYKCAYCGMVMDRDINGAKNILLVGLGQKPSVVNASTHRKRRLKIVSNTNATEQRAYKIKKNKRW